jgi:hypothetical protein
MSKKLLTSLFATCACVALAAQTPAPTTSTTTQSAPAAASQSRDQSPSKADSITVAGCVMRNTATPAASGAVGTSGSAASSFILSSVTKPADSTDAQPAAGAIASSYRLEADDSKVSPHVGHKVEITGTVDKAMASTTTAASGASTAASAPVLKVESVKMVAASCTP